MSVLILYLALAATFGVASAHLLDALHRSVTSREAHNGFHCKPSVQHLATIARELAMYGLRGCRVGEASHPRCSIQMAAHVTN